MESSQPDWLSMGSTTNDQVGEIDFSGLEYWDSVQNTYQPEIDTQTPVLQTDTHQFSMASMASMNCLNQGNLPAAHRSCNYDPSQLPAFSHQLLGMHTGPAQLPTPVASSSCQQIPQQRRTVSAQLPTPMNNDLNQDIGQQQHRVGSAQSSTSATNNMDQGMPHQRFPPDTFPTPSQLGAAHLQPLNMQTSRMYPPVRVPMQNLYTWGATDGYIIPNANDCLSMKQSNSGMHIPASQPIKVEDRTLADNNQAFDASNNSNASRFQASNGERVSGSGSYKSGGGRQQGQTSGYQSEDSQYHTQHSDRHHSQGGHHQSQQSHRQSQGGQYYFPPNTRHTLPSNDRPQQNNRVNGGQPQNNKRASQASNSQPQASSSRQARGDNHPSQTSTRQSQSRNRQSQGSKRSSKKAAKTPRSNNTYNRPETERPSGIEILGDFSLPIDPTCEIDYRGEAEEEVSPRMPSSSLHQTNTRPANPSSILRSNAGPSNSSNSNSNTGSSSRSYPTPEGIIPGNKTALPQWMGYLEFDRNLGAYPRIKDHVLDVSGNVVLGNRGKPLRHIVGKDGKPVLPNRLMKADLLNGRNVYYWQGSHPLLHQSDLFDRVQDYTPEEVEHGGKVNALANIRNRWRAKHGGLGFVPKQVPADKKTFSKWDLQRVDALGEEQLSRGIIWEIVRGGSAMRDPFSGACYPIPKRQWSRRMPLIRERLSDLKQRAVQDNTSWEVAKRNEIINNNRFVVARENRRKAKTVRRVLNSVPKEYGGNEEFTYDLHGEDGEILSSLPTLDQEGFQDEFADFLRGAPLQDGLSDAEHEFDYDWNPAASQIAPKVSPTSGSSAKGLKRAFEEDEDDEATTSSPPRPAKRAALDSSSQDVTTLSDPQAKISTTPVGGTPAPSVPSGTGTPNNGFDPLDLGAFSRDGKTLEWHEQH